jgi:hypothetical protein
MPMQTDEVDCQLHPCWFLQSVSFASCVHGVSAPVHATALGDQLQPGVVHMAWSIS